MLKILYRLLAAASPLLIAGCVSVSLIGCATVRDSRDAAWDPPAGRSLFEQIPAWDGAAEKICCGHLKSCEPHQSPRC
jgi:hypothetical protein